MKVKCIDTAMHDYISLNQEYEVLDEVLEETEVFYIIINDIGRKVKYLKKLFEVVPELKIIKWDGESEIFSKNKYNIEDYGNWRKFRIRSNRNSEHEIRWGEIFNTTLEDVLPIINACGYDIIINPKPKKYKLKTDKEFDESEIDSLKALGLEFEEVE